VATNGATAQGFGAARRAPLTTALASATAKLSLGALRAGALGAGTLAASRTAAGRSPGEAGRLRSLHHRATHASFLPSLALPARTVIRFISVIPLGVWLALAVSLGIAGVAGTAAVRSGRRARRHAGEVAAVTAAALLDPLTGVLNRRGFSAAVERELARAHRYDHPLALAFVDVRGLKAVNDTEGHLAGDRLLKQVGMLLTDSARAHDVVGRIGGDELAVLLVEQSEDGAAAMTRRVRAEIGRHRAALGLRTPWDLTVGTSVFPRDGETFDELLAVADRRLYEQRGIELRAASAADPAGLAAAGASRPQARS
jgi:diguanylate cyclase (GGDEF)-like protein